MSAELSMSEAQVRALPVSVPLVLAGRAFGMAAGKSRELARSGEFPCRVIKVGSRYRVPKSAILDALGLDTGAAGAPSPGAASEQTAQADERSTSNAKPRLRALGA
jgi:hypothetical protein